MLFIAFGDKKINRKLGLLFRKIKPESSPALDPGVLLQYQLVYGEIGDGTFQPGSPRENGYCESFNGKLRDELLSGELF